MSAINRTTSVKLAPEQLAAGFQIIEPLWLKRKKRPKFFSLDRQRWRDLNAIMRHRHPRGTPANIDIEALQYFDAQILGDSLGLTTQERSALKITTIRACDGPTRKEKERQRARTRRLAAGARPHSLSLSRTKPWEAEGISRRTWERRRTASPSRDASPSALNRPGRTCDKAERAQVDKATSENLIGKSKVLPIPIAWPCPWLLATAGKRLGSELVVVLGDPLYSQAFQIEKLGRVA